jgi:hypothetical protein
MHQDEQLISRLGGVVKFATRLGLDPKKGGAQRVQNWKSRGIPAAIERDNPWIAHERNLMRSSAYLRDAPLPQATQEVAHG